LTDPCDFFLVGSVLNASVKTLLMGPLTVFATLDLLEIFLLLFW